MPVPEVLLNGDHQEIRRWRRQRALEKTLRNRPDLLEGAALSDEDTKILARIKKPTECKRRSEKLIGAQHLQEN